MDKFIAGFTRFQNEVFPQSRQLYERLAQGQQPDTLYIGCSDSRVVPNELLQARPGELFVCRNAGNIVPPYGDALSGVGATVEYAVEVLKVRHIAVCGHSDCGAMKAMLTPEKVQPFRSVAQWLHHADRALAVARQRYGDLDAQQLVPRIIEENVITQLDHLMTYPCVAAKVRTGELFLHGLVFDIGSATFTMLDRQTLTFLPLAEAQQRRATTTAPLTV